MKNKESFASFCLSMREIKNNSEKIDPEICHQRMDDLMCTTLRELGFGEGIDIFEKTQKWYA